MSQAGSLAEAVRGEYKIEEGRHSGVKWKGALLAVLGFEKKPMAEASFLVKIRADEKCLSVPGARVIICPKGLFTPDHRLPTGTPVVVQLCEGQHELTLFGIVRTSSADSGLAIEFKETTESVGRKLATLLVAQQS